jgi:hypothetical protein
LLHAYAAMSPWKASDWRNQTYLIVAVFMTTVILSYVSEQRRKNWHAWFDYLIPGGQSSARPVRALDTQPSGVGTEVAALEPAPIAVYERF